MDVNLVLAAVFGALATAVIGPLMVASAQVSRNDRHIAERDEDLEEWIVVQDRELRMRWHEIAQNANAAGVADGGAITAGRVAAQTLVLYSYRDELRKARAFVLRLAVDERWTHRLMRRLRRRPFPRLQTPGRAERLVDFWSEGNARNALSWSLNDILAQLPVRATNKHVDPSVQQT